VKTWGKRILGVCIAMAAIALGSDLLRLATPSVSPPSTAAGWKLSAPAECVNSVPAELRSWRGTSGARRVCRAEYAGAPAMRLTLFEMPEWPGATAFDAFQKWRPAQPGKMGFFRDRYFGVVESPQADRPTLDRFTMAVENALPGRGGSRW
jgi:hypothetical protein